MIEHLDKMHTEQLKQSQRQKECKHIYCFGTGGSEAEPGGKELILNSDYECNYCPNCGLKLKEIDNEDKSNNT